MRDGQIVAMHEANARRAALLFGQWELLNAWQIAYEQVFLETSFFDGLFKRKDFLKKVHARQLAILEEGKRKMEEAAKRPNITVVRGGPAGVSVG